jgi:hypothetical protein
VSEHKRQADIEVFRLSQRVRHNVHEVGYSFENPDFAIHVFAVSFLASSTRYGSAPVPVHRERSFSPPNVREAIIRWWVIPILVPLAVQRRFRRTHVLAARLTTRLFRRLSYEEFTVPDREQVSYSYNQRACPHIDVPSGDSKHVEFLFTDPS